MESWTQTQIFHTGDSFYDSLKADLRQARHTITLESYIFTRDQATQPLLDELAAATHRGCDVKLLIDGFGSYYWLPGLQKFCEEHLIDFRVYHPLPDGLRWFRYFFYIYFFTAKTLNLLKKLNRRNHRKIAIIDERTSYLGSLNFSACHSERISQDKAWRDTGARVQGPGVATLVDAFKNAWRRSYKRGFRRVWFPYKEDRALRKLKFPVRLNSTPRMRYRNYRDLLHRIKTAQKHLYVTTAYFVPKRSLLRALKKAGEKGIQVHLLLPGVTDVPPVRWATFEVLATLLKSGVKVHEYQNRILHAKYMIIDDYYSLGSLNLNHRSLLHDLEVEILLTDEDSKKNLHEQWHKDISQSLPMTEQKLKSNSLWITILSRIAFKLRYLL